MKLRVKWGPAGVCLKLFSAAHTIRLFGESVWSRKVFVSEVVCNNAPCKCTHLIYDFGSIVSHGLTRRVEVRKRERNKVKKKVRK